MNFWTWGGTFFGRRRGDSLYTYHGVEAGRFHDDEIYGDDGRYLGEIRSRNRLITNKSKSHKRKASFTRRHIGGSGAYGAYGGYGMYGGYEDFPDPEKFD
jgi:hypothetical protein